MSYKSTLKHYHYSGTTIVNLVINVLLLYYSKATVTVVKTKNKKKKHGKCLVYWVLPTFVGVMVTMILLQIQLTSLNLK